LVPAGLLVWALLSFHDASWDLWHGLVDAGPSRGQIAGSFVVVAIIHVGEGVWAWSLARRAGRSDEALRWLWQTTLLGVPSLLALRARVGRD
jgi:hypothetical protein